MPEWQVSDHESGMTVLSFIKNRMTQGLSARKLKSAIDSGHCKINQRVERFASKLVGRGDCIHFVIDEELAHHCLSCAFELDAKRVLFDDECFFAYDKPPGIVSDDKQFLASLKNQINPLFLLHRLDRETSGVLLFARTKPCESDVLKQFHQRKIKKSYLAIVEGVLKQKEGFVENYLGKRCIYHGQAIWGEVLQTKGVYAKTSWKLLQQGKRTALIACYPETGRTHQIRVHLSSLGHPLVGDAQYGSQILSKRMMLHAKELAFRHPLKQQALLIVAPIPDDFEKKIEALSE